MNCLKKTLKALFLCLYPGLLFADSGPDVSMIALNAAEKVERSAVPKSNGTETIRVDALRNEHELFQILIRAGKENIQNAGIRVSDLKDSRGNRISAGNIVLRTAHYIHCRKYISTPQWLPDALLPYTGPVPVSALQNQAFYGDLFIPKTAVPGMYEGTVTAEADGVKKVFPITVRVRAMTLGDTPSFQSSFDIWRGPGTVDQLIAPYPQIQSGSPEEKALYERVYEFFVARRLMPKELPVAPDSLEADKYFRDPRVVSFSIPYDPKEKGKFISACDILRKKGVLEKGFVYTIDEPGESKIQYCKDYYDALHASVKDVRFLLTVSRAIAQNIDGKVDIFCPILRDFDYPFYRGWMQKGKNVWWYTCIHPREPFPTYQIDSVGIGHRILSWLQAKYQVQGVLYWSVNIWRQHNNKGGIWYTRQVRDIWNDPSAFPNTNGDGYLIYPAKDPNDDPIPTIRLELIRQGNEDFDTFDLLKKAIRKASVSLKVEYSPEERVFEMVSRIAPEMTDFTKKTEELEALRLDLLDELEALENGPAALMSCSSPEGKLKRGTTLRFQLYTSPDNRVSIVPEVPFKRENHLTEFQFTPSPGPFSLRVNITAPDGKKTTLKREYFVREKDNQVYELFNWSDKIFQRRMRLDKITVWQVPGSPVHGFTFHADTDFPGVLFQGTNDTSLYRWVKVKLENPMNVPVNVIMKYHARNGKTQDGQGISLRPGERKTIVYPLNAEGRTRDEAFNMIQFWMWKKNEERKLIIESVELYSEHPGSE